jgi:cysteinyl-tRNA synthetase
VDVNPAKRHWYDFALWISNLRHIMQWDAPWGRGYPGWHIECSAMSLKHLGTVDIHTGGEDNIFPHHECEIAQSEACTGKKFAAYWLHTRHLLVNGQKMSKSKGNFYTLRDLLAQGHDPKAIRYLLLSAHYRTRLNFTEEGMRAAEKTLESLEEFIIALRGVAGKRYNTKIAERLKRLGKEFVAAMDDDLNISLALARMFDFMKACNKAIARERIDQRNAQEIYQAFLGFDRVLGLDLDLASSEWLTINEAPSGVRELIIRREQHRELREFAQADEIRALLRERHGIILEDTGRGVRWRTDRKKRP